MSRVSTLNRAAIYRKAAEASLLHGNGTGCLTREMCEPMRDDPFYFSTTWDREQWCMAFCLLAAMAEAGDA